MMSKKEFYVYIYLDPRKKGKFTYKDLDISFLYKPFYVGKGKGERCFYHLNESEEKSYNLYKYRKIQNILKQNKIPYIIKIKDGLKESKALAYEDKVIQSIGLENLTNIIPGGLSGIGGYADKSYMQTEEYKNKFRGKNNPMYGKRANKKYYEAQKKYKYMIENEKENIERMLKEGKNQREIAKHYHANQEKLREIMKKLNIDTNYFRKRKSYQDKHSKLVRKTWEKRYQIKFEKYKDTITDLYLNEKLPIREIIQRTGLSDRIGKRIIKDLNLKRKYIGNSKDSIEKMKVTVRENREMRDNKMFEEYQDIVIHYIKQGLYQEEIADKLPFSMTPLRRIFKRLIEESPFNNYEDYRDHLLKNN